ncbi:hemagglutinin repeat-containing protein, partial [Acetonema longum]
MAEATQKCCNRFKKLLVWLLLFFHLGQPLAVQAAQAARANRSRPVVKLDRPQRTPRPAATPTVVVPAYRNPAQNTGHTTLPDTAANGVPISYIQAPSAAGVSYNPYDQFNVGSSGLILNNSYTHTSTELAGYIQGNSNLANGSARIILNEVTGPNPSYLHGYTEVAGPQAEVIIANPYGIVGDGFGFINTSRAVLTTGTPVFDTHGNLDAFRVNQGRITIQGDGLNATNIDRVDLISRATTINAGIWAKKLNVVTGANSVNYQTLAAEKLDAAEEAPAVALDVSDLGGMYANQITLVGTDKGVGVNSKGVIVADNDLIITQEGKVVLSGNTNSKGNMALQGSDVIQSGNLYVQGNARISAAGALENTGVTASGGDTQIEAASIHSDNLLAAGLGSDGTLGTSGSLSLTAQEQAILTGRQLAGQDLTIEAGSMDLSDATTYAGGHASLTATEGDILHQHASLQTGGLLTLHADGALDNQNSSIQAGQLTIEAQTLSNQSGQISQFGEQSAVIQVRETFDNTGGMVQAAGDFTLTANRLVNRQGILAGNGCTDITVTDTFHNDQGTLQSGQGLHLSSASLDNREGSIVNLDSSDLSLTIQESIHNQAGVIGGNGSLLITAQSMDNREGGTVFAQKDLTLTVDSDLNNTGGSLQAAQNLTLISTAGAIRNQSGSIESGAMTKVQAAAIDNTTGRLITSGQELDVKATAGDIDNTGGTIGSNSIATLTAQNLVNRDKGQVLASSDLTITTPGGINNTQGSLFAGGNLTFDQAAAHINNTQGRIGANGNLTLTASSLINTGGTAAANTDVTLTLNSFNPDGKILASQDLFLNLGQSYTHQNGVELFANRNFTLTTAGSFTNNGTLEAVGILSVSGQNITNNAGASLEAGDVSLSADNGTITNHGQIAGKAVHSQSRILTNTGSIFSDGINEVSDDVNAEVNAGIILQADTITNTGAPAVIAARDQIRLYGKTAVENKNGATIYSQGDILIAGSEPHANNSLPPARSGSFLNQSATLEAEGNLGIYAGQIKNTWQSIRAKTTSTSQNKSFADYSKGLDAWGIAYTETITETVVQKTGKKGTILAGNQMHLAGDIENHTSLISAGGDLTYTGSLANLAYKESKLTIRDGDYYKVVNIHGTLPVLGPVKPYYEEISETGDVYAAEFTSNQNLTGSGGDVKNITVTPKDNPADYSVSVNGSEIKTAAGKASNPKTVDPFLFTIPSSSLYQTHPEPGSKYLVETHSRFTSYQNFISSDYLLEQLGFDPEPTHKRLGDGFYEQKLIRDQITELTGRRYLGDYTSDDETYKTLLENGAIAAKDLNLTVGIALTADQIQNLTTDMVWMVEKEVQGQKVLVPVVYLASTTASELNTSGALIAGKNVVLQTAGNVTNTGTIRSDNLTRIDAATTYLKTTQDIVNQSGTISGGQVILDADRDIKNETLTTTIQQKNFTTTLVGQTGSIEATGTLTALAGRDITLTGAQVSAGQDLALQAGRNITVNTVELEEASQTGRNYSQSHESTTHLTSTIQAGNNATLVAQNDLTLHGAQVSAQNDLSALAGGNITVTSVKDRVATEERRGNNKNYTYTKTDDETVVGSQLTAGNNLTLAAVQLDDSNPNTSASRGNVTIEGSSVQTKQGNIAIAADHDVTIQEVAERHESYTETKKTKKKTFSTKTTLKKEHTEETLAIGSGIKSGAALQVTAGNDLTLQGSRATASGAVNLSAANNINITSAVETLVADTATSTKKRGVLSGKVKEQREHTEITTVKGSQVAGATVNVNAGHDLSVIGSDIAGGGDVSLYAKNNLNILSAQETMASQQSSYEKKSGLSLSFSGGFNLFAGTTSLKTTADETRVNQIGSRIGSNGGTLYINAGKDARISGSDIMGATGIQAIAQNITIEGAVNSTQSHFTSEFKQRGLSVSVGNKALRSAHDTYNTVRQTEDTENEYLQALYTKEAYLSGKETYENAGKILANAQDKNIGNSFTASAGFSSSQQKTESFTSSTGIRSSRLASNGPITLIATGSGQLDPSGQAADGDLNLFGSLINGSAVYLSAARDVNLKAQANTMDASMTSSGKSSGFGVTADLGKTPGMGYYLEGSKSSGNSQAHSTTWTETQISGTTDFTMVSGRDINMIGAQVHGDSITVNVGRNLKLESLQDIETYSEKNKSVGGRLGIGTDTNVGFNKGTMDSTYQSVNEQTGLFAGKGGFNITVKDNTTIKGAVLDSEATPDKNKLDTGTLTWSAIENRAEYSASSTGVNYAIGKDVEEKDKGWTPNMGIPVSDDKNSTTHAAIAQGTIVIRDPANQKADLSKLSRDTENTTQALDRIFDKKTVQERQELVKMFGEEAFNQVHIISKNNGWKEGSLEKIALHAAVGGIMSQMGGGSFTSGAVGAGVNEAVQTELVKLFEKNPDLHQWASFALGAAAAKLAGGNAQAGGTAAASGTRNNLYWEYVNKEKALKEANVPPEKAQEIMDEFNNDAINNYDLGNEVEYESAYNLGIDENGDEKRLNRFIEIARNKGLNDDQINSIVTNFNEQLRAGKTAHGKHVIDSAMYLTAGGLTAVEIYTTLEAGVILYQFRKMGNATSQ